MNLLVKLIAIAFIILMTCYNTILGIITLVFILVAFGDSFQEGMDSSLNSNGANSSPTELLENVKSKLSQIMNSKSAAAAAAPPAPATTTATPAPATTTATTAPATTTATVSTASQLSTASTASPALAATPASMSQIQSAIKNKLNATPATPATPESFTNMGASASNLGQNMITAEEYVRSKPSNTMINNTQFPSNMLEPSPNWNGKDGFSSFSSAY